MLEGKVFCIKLVAKSMDEAQKTSKTIRSKIKIQIFKTSKSLIEEVDEKKDEEKKKNKENIVDEKETVIV